MGKTDKAPAGWYVHPEMANTQRYWDGEAWTDKIAPGTPAVEGGEPDNVGLLVAGWVMTALFPVGGFIAGCILLAKGRPGHGVAMMLLSCVSMAFWYDILTPDPTYVDYDSPTYP